MLIKSQKDFFSGLMFMAIGIAFAVGATNYTVGTAARMGPGYFPLLLGILLAVLGGLIVLTSIIRRNPPPDGDPIGRWVWKPLFFILAANFAFGVLLVGLPSVGIPSMGLIVAIYALTIIASLASPEFSIKGALGLATVLAVGSYLVFIKSLSLVLPVWPSFVG
ncbi:tripartite tricarboxylate transporter TctB family protein [Corticibacter populi]|uniref:Tripartite tricarboxylate transporter TctB family protein n=1 Tax=Corticibacter populi TaxID=1550736 RepID=A0A3M6R0W8_9BURK|nr:tripartite tricarboxylate transporter TctB family protein [Corticibacter populi]RMX08900.1 tripartite tricarboxylate transporter TctB family protein [Corticibacter populi]RZS35769.1 tripartite tricarboxylate transporter TctB family protein [Corticibacter populi]